MTWRFREAGLQGASAGLLVSALTMNRTCRKPGGMLDPSLCQGALGEGHHSPRAVHRAGDWSVPRKLCLATSSPGLQVL